MPAPTRKAPIAIAPELVRLHEAFAAANRMLAGQHDEALRAAMTAAALGVVIKEAQRVIDGFAI